MREKKLTEKQLYTAKLAELRSRYSEIDPLIFYRELFPAGSFEEQGFLTGKPNGVLVAVDDTGIGKQRLIFDDLETLKEYQGIPNVIMSPIGYFGRRRTSKNASAIYAMVFDLDGQNMQELKDTLYQMYETCLIPPATYIALSGHGLHLYYVFEEPIAMKPYIQRELNKLKAGLTKIIWNAYTSNIDKPQMQPITQGFRIVGSASKLGKRYPVRIFKTGKKTTASELVEWIPNLKEWDQYKANVEFEDCTPIEEAKKLWPDWYERRIVRGKPRGVWAIKRDLYDWWLGQIKRGATVGHRYFSIMTLAIYAYKCQIDRDELERDAYALVPLFDAMSESESNRFTEQDVRTALQAYRTGANNYPRDLISKLSGITIPENKRNYRTRAEHLKGARALQAVYNPDWRNKDGRPKGSGTKAEKVKAWRLANPNGKKIECHRETGITRPTIDKWWNN